MRDYNLHKPAIFFSLILLFLLFLWISKKSEDGRPVVYAITELNDSEYIHLNKMSITYFTSLKEEQPITEEEIDLSTLNDDNRFNKKTIHCSSKIINLNQLLKLDYSHNKSTDLYHSFGISTHCSDTVYLLIRSYYGVTVWLNKQLLHSSIEHVRPFGPDFSDFVCLPLQEGENEVIIGQTDCSNKEFYFEGIICRKEFLLKEYEKKYQGMMVNPPESDTLFFKFNENLYLAKPSTAILKVHTVAGKCIVEKELPIENRFLLLSELDDNQVYMVSIDMEGVILRQPICKGDPDGIYELLKEKINIYSPVRDLSPYLYRIEALLEHESRNVDWWWKLKFSSVIYEATLLVEENNVEEQQRRSTGICLYAYESALDNSDQHYLLITPDSIEENLPLPLVVVIRPYNENHHHFLTSPQVARYWILKYAKALANLHNYIIMLPEARMYGYEELTPMAEVEILQAIEDVKNRYGVDEDRIYLHGNCSGAYRCISLLAKHPDLFAACALYGPTTRGSTIYNKENRVWHEEHDAVNLTPYLSNIPILIQYDKLDTHLSYLTYQDFMNKLSMENPQAVIVSKDWSSRDYSYLIVGKEAFEFFRHKERSKEKRSLAFSGEKVIADVFVAPYLFVYDEYNLSDSYLKFKDTLRISYEKNFWALPPMISSEEITEEIFLEKNLILLGYSFQNQSLQKLLESAPFNLVNHNLCIENKFIGSHKAFQLIFPNSYNEDRNVVVMSATDDDLWDNMDVCIWNNGLSGIKLFN